jgi:hypothetical protein
MGIQKALDIVAHRACHKLLAQRLCGEFCAPAVELGSAQMGDERIERFWTLARDDDQASSLACDLFTTAQGLEVRCHTGTAVLRAQHVASMADAINLCEAWKVAYRGDGWIEPFA